MYARNSIHLYIGVSISAGCQEFELSPIIDSELVTSTLTNRIMKLWFHFRNCSTLITLVLFTISVLATNLFTYHPFPTIHCLTYTIQTYNQRRNIPFSSLVLTRISILHTIHTCYPLNIDLRNVKNVLRQVVNTSSGDSSCIA